MPKSNPGDSLATAVQSMIQGDGAAIAARLQTELSTGATKLTRDQFLQLVGRNWGDPSYRQGLLQQIGPDQFVAAWKDAVKAGYVQVQPTPETTQAPQGGTLTVGQDPTMGQALAAGPSAPVAPMSGDVAPGQPAPMGGGMIPGMGG